MSITASQLALWPEITHIVGKHFDHCNSAGVYCHGPEADIHVKKKHKHAYAPHLVQHVSPAEHADTDARHHVMNATDTTTAVPSPCPAADDQPPAAGDSTTAADNIVTAAAENATATECDTAAPAKAAAAQPVSSMDKQALALCSTIIASCNGDEKLLNVLVSYLRRAQNTIDGIKARNSLGKARSAPAAAQKLDAPHDSIADLAATLTQRRAAAGRSTACPAAHSNRTPAQLDTGVVHAAPLVSTGQDQPPHSVACSASAAAEAEQQQPGCNSKKAHPQQALSVPDPGDSITQQTTCGLGHIQDGLSNIEFQQVAQNSSSAEVSPVRQMLSGLQRPGVANPLLYSASPGCKAKKRKISTEPAASHAASLCQT